MHTMKENHLESAQALNSTYLFISVGTISESRNAGSKGMYYLNFKENIKLPSIKIVPIYTFITVYEIVNTRC